MLDNPLQATETKWFQWIKGDNTGKTVEWVGESIYDDYLDMKFLLFKDGSRVNDQLIGEWVIEVVQPISNPTQPPKIATTPQAPIKKTTPDIQYNPQETEKPKVLDSPIHQILKDSKKTRMSINISLLVESPPPNLMSVLAETYPDGETQVLDYIAQTINIEDLRQQISQQIWLAVLEPDKKTIQKKYKKNGIESIED
jgi:hypothetical protein